MDSLTHRLGPFGRQRSVRQMAVTVVVMAVLLGAVASGCKVRPVRMVGPGHAYATPCEAIAAAQPGDAVKIDAMGNGTYDGDVCTWTTDDLVIVGVNGRARIDAAGQHSGGKGIWVIGGDDTVIRNVELSGAAVPDRNGAGIRHEGRGLTIVGSYFHDNENGILSGADPENDIVVDSSEFARNGAGDGYSHNIYIGRIRSFTLRSSYSHDAVAGHLVKSRAATNQLLFNRLTGEGGSSSYELDLPNGGVAYVIGNTMQQGPTTQNSALMAFGEEGATHPVSQLFAVNNTFVNDRGSGTAVVVGPQVTLPVLAQNNVSTGSSTFVTQATASLVTNCLVADPVFVDRVGLDHRLAAGSPCLDVGTPPGFGLGIDLTPTQQHVVGTGPEPRVVVGPAIDAGAFEH